MDLELLREQATRFRAAIECCARKTLPITFENFPHGSCGDVTLLLGTFLADYGLGAFTYMLGERIDGAHYQSHAWLEVEGAIVDITADQFDELMEPVMVVGRSDWHAAWRGKAQYSANFRRFDPATVARLEQAYQVIPGAIVTPPYWYISCISPPPCPLLSPPIGRSFLSRSSLSSRSAARTPAEPKAAP